MLTILVVFVNVDDIVVVVVIVVFVVVVYVIVAVTNDNALTTFTYRWSRWINFFLNILVKYVEMSICLNVYNV